MTAETDGLWAEINRLRAEADELRKRHATIWLYFDRRNEDRPIFFDSLETANAWFEIHDPEGVAFEYPVVSQTKKAAPG